MAENEKDAKVESKPRSQEDIANDPAKDPRDEGQVKPREGTPDKPVADANADEVLPGGDRFNYLDTRGLTAAQAARINGTPLDGANGAVVLGPDATRTPDRGARLAAATRERAAEEKKASKKASKSASK